jgi:hypothetical protein
MYPRDTTNKTMANKKRSTILQPSEYPTGEEFPNDPNDLPKEERRADDHEVVKPVTNADDLLVHDLEPCNYFLRVAIAVAKDFVKFHDRCSFHGC